MSVRRHSAIRLENYFSLIAQLARLHHGRLPTNRRIWIDVEDMIHDGIEITTTTILPTYTRTRGTQFTTWLTNCLDHYYQNYVKASYCQKRNQGMNIPLEDIEYLLADSSFKLTIDGFAAKEMLLKIYELASVELKYYMCLWFFVNDSAIPNPNDRRAVASTREFLLLANKFGVTYDVCKAFFAQKSTGVFANGLQRKITH